MQHRFRSALAVACLAGLAAVCSAASAPLKVAFVYLGPIAEGGWTYQHNLGRLALEKEFGSRIETTYIENVPETADAERVIRQLASRDYAVIFATSFGYMQPTLKVAKLFPKVKFEHATGYKTAANVVTYQARSYIDEVKRILDGTWSGERQARSAIKQGVVVLTPLNPVVPANVAPQFASNKQAIGEGSLLPFAGPIRDNSGAPKVAAGASVSLDELLAINWYVEGVDGSVPK
jgi:basic membrane lipoprotein Med (substrate-binding protein (PBP1-ABC) superfamily)